MIKRCQINNFKSLKKCELKSLKRINLLGGKNNTGKTALMEALFLFYDRLNPECFIRLHAWRGVTSIQMESEELFAPFFNEYNTKNKIEIEIEDSKRSTKCLTIDLKNNTEQNISISNINLNNIDTTTKSLSNECLQMRVKYTGSQNKKQEIITHLIEGQNNLNINAQNVNPNYVEPAVFLVAKQHNNSNENAIRYGELVKKNTEYEILDFLKIIEPRLTSISTIQQHDKTSMLYGNIGLEKKVPLNYMGDGITKILSILLAIISTKDGVVFIDEVENGIHHSVMSDVWKMIDIASKKYNCQIFATTHSYECLAATIEGVSESPKDLSYIRLERKDNEIINKEYDYGMLEIAVNKGWEVR